MMSRIATVLAVLGALFIGYIGISYLTDPQAIAAGFGFRQVPADNSFLLVKGVRDLVSGLIIVTLLVTGQRRALGWTMLALAAVPLGDAIVVLSQNGVPALAYLMHGGTAVIVALTGALLLRTSRRLPTKTAA
ncbi:DUF4267 domain-containing protein [Nonomuraea sp. NPDC059194]|uniref:DUF4267 domain-containing protein n=1 Tax=Nonomuraea sp. NPDC059194 TaxID=3346764 RepID=UPI0036CEB58C